MNRSRDVLRAEGKFDAKGGPDGHARVLEDGDVAIVRQGQRRGKVRKPSDDLRPLLVRRAFEMVHGTPRAEKVAVLDEREGMPACSIAGCRMELLFARSFDPVAGATFSHLERRDLGPADAVQA